MRFSLKALLILVTVLGLFLGYAQWRKTKLIQECRELVAEGIGLQIPEGVFWPTAPDSAGIGFEKVGPDRFANGSKFYSTSEAIEHFNHLKARLHALGVEKVFIPFIRRENGEQVLVTLASINGLVGMND